MIKKHSITCSVICVLFIILKLFVYSVPDKQPLKNSPVIFNFFEAKKVTEVTDSVLNFAEEAVPVQNAKVNRKVRYSIWKHSRYASYNHQLQARAKRYFPLIEPIMELYGIPEDMKYIPLLESGLQPHVRSPRGAAGVWQFMPATARQYGLRVNRKTDERLNTRKATIAACKYLKDLYAQFNSWTLAAAAFNGGSPRIAKAINHKNKGNYFYMRLNRETGSYVYSLVAMKEMMDKQAESGAEPGTAGLLPSEVLTIN